MPNDCWNYVTITSQNPEELNTLLQNEIKNYHQVDIKKKGKNGVIMRIWSPWAPNFEWFSGLLDNYPGCWIKNEWDEEGGMAGVWVGFIDENREKNIRSLEWKDLCLEEKYYLFLPDTDTDKNKDTKTTINKNICKEQLE